MSGVEAKKERYCFGPMWTILAHIRNLCGNSFPYVTIPVFFCGELAGLRRDNRSDRIPQLNLKASTSEGRAWSSEDIQPCSFKVVSRFRTLLL